MKSGIHEVCAFLLKTTSLFPCDRTLAVCRVARGAPGPHGRGRWLCTQALALAQRGAKLLLAARPWPAGSRAEGPTHSKRSLGLL